MLSNSSVISWFCLVCFSSSSFSVFISCFRWTISLRRSWSTDFSSCIFCSISCKIKHWLLNFSAHTRYCTKTAKNSNPRWPRPLGHSSNVHLLRCSVIRRIAVAGPTAWNQLPADVRSTESVNSFKTVLKTFLLIRQGRSDRVLYQYYTLPKSGQNKLSWSRPNNDVRRVIELIPQWLLKFYSLPPQN